MMDLDELRTVRRTEREKDSLQHLRDSFYEDVAAYLADLEARRDRAAAEADDPFASPEVRKLTDEIETAEEVSEAIYERRVGKIVKQASFAAADMSADREGLTEQETDLFDDLVERIKRNKRTVLDVLAREGDAADSAAPSVASGSPDPAADAPSPDSRSAAEPSPTEARAEHQADPVPAGVGDGASDSEVASESGGDAGSVLADAMGGNDATDSDAPGRDTTEPDAPESASEKSAPPGATADSDVGSPPSGAPTAAPPGDARSPTAEATPGDADDAPGATPAGADATAAASDSAEAAIERDSRSADDRSDDSSRSSDGRDADPTPTTDGGAADLQRTTVRITRDVGSILGVDEREYDLEREDVVTLPSTNAEPLVERDAAERLE